MEMFADMTTTAELPDNRSDTGIPPGASPSPDPVTPDGERTAEERLLDVIVGDAVADEAHAEAVVEAAPPVPPAEPVVESVPEPVPDLSAGPSPELPSEFSPEPAAPAPDEAEIRRLQDELASVRAELQAVAADRDDLARRLDIAATEFDRLHGSLDEAKREGTEYQSALESARTALKEAQAAATEARAQAEAALKDADAARQAHAADGAQAEARDRRLRDERDRMSAVLREAQEALAATARPRWVMAAGVAAVAVAAGIVGVLLGHASSDRSNPAPVADIALPSADPAGVGVSTCPPVPAEPRPGPPAVVAPAWPVIRDERITTREEPGGLVILFNEPVFGRGIELSAAGRQDLRRVAALLKPHAVAFRFEVEGHTDSSPVSGGRAYASNHELGLARARAALDVLTREGLPPTCASLSSAADANPLFPGDTPEARRRNRTVVIKLHAAKDKGAGDGGR